MAQRDPNFGLQIRGKVFLSTITHRQYCEADSSLLTHPRISHGDESSSDGENAGEVKNVARLVMRPPGHSGKAKKGHLVFDAAFEGGNLGRVDYVGDVEYDLYVRPDSANPRHRVWFYFAVENVRADQRVVFTFVNFSKLLYLYQDGFSPVVKSTSRPKWVRIPSKNIFYYRSPEHRNRYVLTMVFSFDKEDDVYHFAFSYPYTYSRLQKYLDILESKAIPFVKRKKIGESLQGRRIDMVSIICQKEKPEESEKKVASAKKLKPGKKRKIIVVAARVHPGETPSSYVCQGMMNFLIGDNPIAKTLREHISFVFIPMLNPDGVFLGNYRTSVLGQDLNRSWQETSQYSFPILTSVKTLLQGLITKTEELDIFLDLHAHTSLLGTFVYGNNFEDVYRYQRHSLFPKHLGYCAEDFSPQNTVFNKDPKKAGSARRKPDTFWATTGLYPQSFVLALPELIDVNTITFQSYNVMALSIEKTVKEDPVEFEEVFQTVLDNTEGTLQKKSISPETCEARFLKFIIKSGYDHFCSVHRVILT